MNYLKNSISTYAFRNAKYKSFRDEHWVAIIFAWIARITTAGVSIYSGWFFFINYLKPISQSESNIPLILSFFILVSVEFLAAYLITKLTKSIIHKQYSVMLIIAVFTLGIFGLSFYSSTNGLAARQSKKADDSDQIIHTISIKRQQVINNYNKQIIELKEFNKLELDNLQGWIKGKRAVLSETQMKRIKNNNNRISELNNQKKSDLLDLKSNLNFELEQNRRVMMNEADKYWLFIAVVLIISVLSNVSLQSFSHIIYKQEEKEAYMNGYIQAERNKISDGILKQSLKEISSQTEDILHDLLLSSKLNEKHKTIEAPLTDQSIESAIKTKTPKPKTLNDIAKDFHLNNESNNGKKKEFTNISFNSDTDIEKERLRIIAIAMQMQFQNISLINIKKGPN